MKGVAALLLAGALGVGATVITSSTNVASAKAFDYVRALFYCLPTWS
jgi:hypothetical protein